MALDTAQKRFSMLGFGDCTGGEMYLPNADGMEAEDRAHLCLMCGAAFEATVVINVMLTQYIRIFQLTGKNIRWEKLSEAFVMSQDNALGNRTLQDTLVFTQSVHPGGVDFPISASLSEALVFTESTSAPGSTFNRSLSHNLPIEAVTRRVIDGTASSSMSMTDSGAQNGEVENTLVFTDSVAITQSVKLSQSFTITQTHGS